MDSTSCVAHAAVAFPRGVATRDELPLIYAENYFAQRSGDTEGQGYLDYLADEPSHREIARDRLQILGRHSRPGRLLDVGAFAVSRAEQFRRFMLRCQVECGGFSHSSLSLNLSAPSPLGQPSLPGR